MIHHHVTFTLDPASASAMCLSAVARANSPTGKLSSSMGTEPRAKSSTRWASVARIWPYEPPSKWRTWFRD